MKLTEDKIKYIIIPHFNNSIKLNTSLPSSYCSSYSTPSEATWIFIAYEKFSVFDAYEKF